MFNLSFCESNGLVFYFFYFSLILNNAIFFFYQIQQKKKKTTTTNTNVEFIFWLWFFWGTSEKLIWNLSGLVFWQFQVSKQSIFLVLEFISDLLQKDLRWLGDGFGIFFPSKINECNLFRIKKSLSCPLILEAFAFIWTKWAISLR